MSVFDYIIKNNLPLSLTKVNDNLIINCHSWDIQEIDDVIQLFRGTREGFYIRLTMECIYERTIV